MDASDSSTPLHERETQEMLSFYDAYLPDNPVSIFCFEEDDVLLRLRIKAVNDASLSYKGVHCIRLRLPNNEFVDLKMQQVRQTNCGTLDAVCLFESCMFKDVIAQNTIASSSGFGGLTYCRESMVHVYVTLTVPHRNTAIVHFALRFKFFYQFTQ